MRGTLIGELKESDLPRRCCARCAYFGIDAEPRHHLIDGRYLEGWVSRCDFDTTRTSAEFLCDRFADRDDAEARRRRELFGYERPVRSVEGAVQADLLAEG